MAYREIRFIQAERQAKEDIERSTLFNRSPDKERIGLELRASIAQTYFPPRPAQPRRITPLELETILRQRPDIPRREKENYARRLLARNPEITVGELAGAIDRYSPGIVEAQIEDIAKQRKPELWGTAAVSRRILSR